MSHYFVAPATDPQNRYAAGLDGNAFESVAEAREAIGELRALGGEWDIEWIVGGGPDVALKCHLCGYHGPIESDDAPCPKCGANEV